LGAGIAGDGRRKLELQAYYFVCTVALSSFQQIVLPAKSAFVTVAANAAAE
jgi:hypothetical protein